MQGSIIPLAETYANEHPFLGVVLAGVFTEGSITQLRSHGFGVLYFPFASIVAAFHQVGIDASFDESSSDREVQRKVAACEKLREADWTKIVGHLRRLHRNDIQTFLHELEVSLSRTVQTVFVLVLHDRSFESATIDDAVRFIETYDESSSASRFCRYEVNVRYTNGDEVRANFASKLEAVRFLTSLR